MTLAPAPIEMMRATIGVQLAPVAIAGVIFTLGTLVALLLMMIAEYRSDRATPTLSFPPRPARTTTTSAAAFEDAA